MTTDLRQPRLGRFYVDGDAIYDRQLPGTLAAEPILVQGEAGSIAQLHLVADLLNANERNKR